MVVRAMGGLLSVGTLPLTLGAERRASLAEPTIGPGGMGPNCWAAYDGRAFGSGSHHTASASDRAGTGRLSSGDRERPDHVGRIGPVLDQVGRSTGPRAPCGWTKADYVDQIGR